MFVFCFFFFFNDTATTEIYTLSLHDALPIWSRGSRGAGHPRPRGAGHDPAALEGVPVRHVRPAGRGRLGHPRELAGDAVPCPGDRKSTRLNSSHANISYAVFCLKKKKQSNTR